MLNMTALEASVEILKIVAASESFDNLTLEEKTQNILETFKVIYTQVSGMKKDFTSENFDFKIEKITQASANFLDVQNFNPQEKVRLFSSMASVINRDCGKD